MLVFVDINATIERCSEDRDIHISGTLDTYNYF